MKRKSNKPQSSASQQQPSMPAELLSKSVRMDEMEIEPSNLPLIWVDKADILRRGDLPLVMLRFYSVVGVKMTEAVRIQTSTQHIQRLIDALAQVIGHYPEKPKNGAKEIVDVQVKKLSSRQE